VGWRHHYCLEQLIIWPFCDTSSNVDIGIAKKLKVLIVDFVNSAESLGVTDRLDIAGNLSECGEATSTFRVVAVARSATVSV
jgi:hypothetical protein